MKYLKAKLSLHTFIPAVTPAALSFPFLPLFAGDQHRNDFLSVDVTGILSPLLSWSPALGLTPGDTDACSAVLSQT